MKNNRITLGQFSASMFLCGLISLLFIDEKCCLWSTLSAAAAVGFNLLVFQFYRGGGGRILKGILGFYSFALCVCVLYKFCFYMYSDLGYEPGWGIALLAVGFGFFCAVKGVEAISRASVLIVFFVIFSVLYIGVSSFYRISPKPDFALLSNLNLPLVILFPSAQYVLNRERIIPKKKYIPALFSALLIMIVSYFSFLPDNNVAVGIFKGADGLLLAIVTVSLLYILSFSTLGIFQRVRHRFFYNSVFLGIIYVITLAALYV